jgi:hypothetical protein
MSFGQRANEMSKNESISKELWARTKGMAAVRGKDFGEYLREALEEKNEREFNLEAHRNEKSI